MKKLSFLVMLFAITIQAQQSSSSVKIGDIKDGGIVFYINDSGEHGLVCALSNQSTAATWSKRKPARRNERLSENFNTSKTIFGKKSNKRNSEAYWNAKKLCKKLIVKVDGKKFKDYYLPSKDELLKLYENREIINKAAIANNGQKLENSIYWSATEFDYTSAVIINFKDGKEGHYYKNYLYSVRAIRTF